MHVMCCDVLCCATAAAWICVRMCDLFRLSFQCIHSRDIYMYHSVCVCCPCSRPDTDTHIHSLTCLTHSLLSFPHSRLCLPTLLRFWLQARWQSASQRCISVRAVLFKYVTGQGQGSGGFRACMRACLRASVRMFVVV